MTTHQRPAFNYNPSELKRELLPYYIGTDQNDIQEMLSELGLESLDQLFSHIQTDVKFSSAPDIGKHLNYEELADHLYNLSNKNNPKISFLGDGLPDYKETDIVGEICSIRGLTTAYTPYQPERSQGTLQTLWIYQSLLSELTGFEAINASLYERSTCLYEAINAATRLSRKSTKILIASSLYPQDIKVLETLREETNLEFDYIGVDENTGQTNMTEVKNKLSSAQYAGVVFPQVNTFGVLEDVDQWVDLTREYKAYSIAIVDPILLATNGLKEPSKFGSTELGSDMVVGEGQHLSLGANFGGPGLGIFGIRYNPQSKNAIRSTAGRYVGKAKDINGKDCLALILSTREQHIRREKATSNICSNQSFVASLTGATLLRRGEQGLTKSIEIARENCLKASNELLKFEGVELRFSNAFYNEMTLKIDHDVDKLIDQASDAGLWIGVNISDRLSGNDQLLKISFSDKQTDQDIEKLIKFFSSVFNKEEKNVHIMDIPGTLLRKTKAEIPTLEREDIIQYYQNLGNQNLSPDDSIYPLGSCTMKYNPYINDWAASLKGFTSVHPQAPIRDAQGCLEVLYETQEIFKAITGLAAVTTQPVAGAQGELVGIKMFQAYHRDRGENRNLILIPRSAHGTNPATATMAGFETKKVDGEPVGIYLIDANEKGEMNLEQIKECCEKYGNKISGIMVTNPNTAGIFETNFKAMSEIIHNVGGLVYMDGANMNAIASWVDLGKLGVDAVHNNLHKTWTIPHGGGGPGDAIVAVSETLKDYLPGYQFAKVNGTFTPIKTPKSIGEFHRHWGNFAHKVRAYTYIKALGSEGVRQMSAIAVLSARYIQQKLQDTAPMLPFGANDNPRMHEFIVTLSKETFEKIEASGTPKANAIARIGKLFLDFGFHAPTVAFPEQYGLMIEPTESFSKKELDDFTNVIKGIYELINTSPEVLKSVPHFTPIARVDEVSANKTPVLSEKIKAKLPEILKDKIEARKLRTLPKKDIFNEITKAHQEN